MLNSHQPGLQYDGPFVCPLCRGKLTSNNDSYQCSSCNRAYPVFFGIPDFRIRSDRYLSLEEERGKAARIATEAAPDFSSMLDYYYEITDDVPPTLAARYKGYHYNGPEQARRSLKCVGLNASDILLDAGCGTGGTLITAAETCQQIYGMDIALRWLVICQQRLKERGINATLVCADIESPPFPEHFFSKIVATDLLENVYAVNGTLKSLCQLLKNRGQLWLASSNKYCLGPHPTTRLWAIGYFPMKLRKQLVKWFRGVDSLRYINLVSPSSIKRYCKNMGLQAQSLSPRIIEIAKKDDYPLIDRCLISIYSVLTRVPLIRQGMVWVGPAFELVLIKSNGLTEKKEVNTRCDLD